MELERIDGGVELVEEVDERRRRMEGEVARPGAGAGAPGRLRPGLECAGRGVEGEGRDDVAAEAGGEGEAVRRIGLDRMRVRRRAEGLPRRAGDAVVADRAHRHQALAIRSAEEPAAAADRVRSSTCSPAAGCCRAARACRRGVDGEAQHRERRRADRGVEPAPVAAHRQRHDGAAGRHLLHRDEGAARRIEAKHRDLVAVGAGDVDDRPGHRLLLGRSALVRSLGDEAAALEERRRVARVELAAGAPRRRRETARSCPRRDSRCAPPRCCPTSACVLSEKP